MNRRHYNDSNDFFELFEADTFDEEHNDKGRWHAYYKEDDGTITLAAEFIYDNMGGGTGWHL